MPPNTLAPPRSPRPTTAEIARDRSKDPNQSVFPVELARGVYIADPPGLRALKLLHLLMKAAGAELAEDVGHKARVADLVRGYGMGNLTRDVLRGLLIELHRTTLVCEFEGTQNFAIGGILDDAFFDDGQSEDAPSGAVVRWQFSARFRAMAGSSVAWVFLRRALVFAFRSAHSLLLYQHLSTYFRRSHSRERVFTVEHLRAIMGVSPDTLRTFGAFKQRVLSPAVAEINGASGYALTLDYIKTGRAVTSVKVSWRCNGGGAFPAINGVLFTPPFDAIARDVGISTAAASREVADDFRAEMDARGISLDDDGIGELFRAFCQYWAAARGVEPHKDR